MIPPPGFDPDPEMWLHYVSFGPEYAMDFYPLVMRTLVKECSLGDQDLAEAIPDAEALDFLNLTVTSCLDHPNPREFFLAAEAGMQLVWRIDEKFPDSVPDSPRLALRVLYNAIQAAKHDDAH